MSKLHQAHGRADADTDKGELRKPDDYSNQPGQLEDDGPGSAAAPGAVDAPRPAPPDRARVGTAPREYGHSSGDRNTMDAAHDWDEFAGGIQRDATPDAPLDPDKRPDDRPSEADRAP